MKYFFLCLSLTFSMQVYADETPQAKGLRIATESDAANAGYGGESSLMEMVLINAHGDQTTRKMTSKVLEMKSDGDRSLINFEWPADVKGTRMLTWSHKTANDDQWLYLPSLKRVKRINSRSKSGSFMGSEFAYEDLGSQEIEKYRYKWLSDETIDGRKHWVIERIPTDKKSGYSKQVVWIDQGYNQAVKIDFYDRKGDHLKTFTLSQYKKYDRWWRAGKIEAVNHQTSKRSILQWKNRTVGKVPDTDLFTKDGLTDW